MKSILIGALLASTWANSAIAEDYVWSGIYGGVSLGARWAGFDQNHSEAWLDHQSIMQRPKGLVAGGFAGYNWQIDRAVLGLEASALFGSASDEDYNALFDTDIRSKASALYSINARVGFAVDRALPYLTAGYSYGRVSTDYVVGRSYRGTEFNDHLNRSGWNIGAGIDWAMTQHLIGRVEYRYHSLGKLNEGQLWDIKYDQHITSIGLAYKF